jgi:glycosyltransferase involved in cell wall biosynthesis
MKTRAQAKPSRIALVTSGFDIGGGVPTVARWLRDSLRSIGYVVDVHDLATSSRDPYSRRLLEPKSWVRRSLRNRSADEDSVIHWGANAVEIETMRYRPRRELSQALHNYDLIQVVAGTPALAATVAESRLPTVLLVATTVEWERQQHLAQQTGALGLWRRAMTATVVRVERRALGKVDAVLVLNSAMLDRVKSAGQGHVIKTPPGIDTTVFSPAITGWRPDGHLLSVCRLSDPRKGLERMIRAYADLVKLHESVPHLVLAGRGQLPSPLLTLIADLGISSRVAIRPNVDRGEQVALYRGASVFVQTSYEEGLGMSVVEAMACGLPVVCTDTAGARESVVNAETGWLVPQDSEPSVPTLVAKRVLQVLRGDGAVMGRRARERCETVFSNEVAVTRFREVYDDLLKRDPA